mgnify:FL=1
MKNEQIIAAARRLFNRYGFKKVSMDEIAREAGVTKKTIYMYFSSKEELLKYFIQEEIINMKSIVEEVENKKMDFYETVNEAIYKLLKYKKDRDFLSIIAEEAELLKNPAVIKNLDLIDEKIQEYIKEKIQSAIDNGYINCKNVDVTAFLVYKMYIALIFDWNEKNKELDEHIIADNISEILRHGLERK